MTCVHYQRPVRPLELSTHNLDPNTTAFVDMTSLIDFLRLQFFLPFLHQRGQITPILSSEESVRLSRMALRMSRYDRTPAFDQRGQWPFFVIAGPDEIWTAEVLLTVVLGKWISCESPDKGSSTREDVLFLNELLGRLMI
jgi:hypothetical protein